MSRRRWNLGNVFKQAKAALPHGEFLPWVERNAGYSNTQVQIMMNVAEFPLIDEIHARRVFEIDVRLLTAKELAAAGREVKRGVEPQVAVKKIVGLKREQEATEGKPAPHAAVKRFREPICPRDFLAIFQI